MSIVDLTTFKQHIRELTNDLDNTLQLALDSATAETNHFLGYDVEDEHGSEIPSDIVMACMLLAQVHADAGAVEDAEYRRGAAHRLLTPYRLSTGFGSLAA